MATNEKPHVEVPSDQPPSYQLELDDIEVGDGDEAVAGKRGAGGVIGPDETLVFVVDLLGVR